jgi:hypothetical protein
MHLFKNQLTNTDPTVQDKARYFADCFDFYLRHIGTFCFPALESHHSLLEKIRFQLVRYDSYAKKYIQHHAANKLLDSKDRMITGFYKGFIPLIMDIRSHVYTDAVARVRLITEIDSALATLQGTLSQNALAEVIDVMHCPEPLVAHDHLELIDYCTGIIVSEFLLAGFPVKDLEDLMGKVLTKEIKLSNNKPVTDFPLPVSLENSGDKDEDSMLYYERVQKFMENRTLREQFEGIYNWFVAKPKPCIVLVRVMNVSSRDAVNKTYGKVTLTSNPRPVLTGDVKRRVKEFTIKKDQLYFKVTFESHSNDAAELTAFDLINKELSRFENYFGNRLYIDYSGFVIKLADHYYYKISYVAQRIAKPDPQKNRAENAIAKINSQASQIFLQQEALYSLAKMTELKELRVAYYWTYLESFFPMEGVKAEQIQKDVAEILANSNILFVTTELFLTAHEILMAHRYDGIKTPSHELSYLEITKFLSDKHVTNVWLQLAITISNHPFLNTHLKPLLNQKVKTTYPKLRQFYGDVLLETYEQRNFVQHAGIYHTMALDKVLRSLPNMVRDFRALVLDKIKKKPNFSMEEVLADLKKPSSKLTKSIKENSRNSALVNI